MRTSLKILFYICFFTLTSSALDAQTGSPFTRADSLRGSLNQYRSNFNVHFYHLNLRIDPAAQRIKGSNEIHFKALEDIQTIQLDLFDNLVIDSILYQQQPTKFRREGNAFFVDFNKAIQKDALAVLTVYYGGKPLIAERPPWDGGFVWKKDITGKAWVGVACEGLGASVWWPNKDHLSDEPDSMRMTFQVPDHLMAVSNGQYLEKKQLNAGYAQYDWKVTYPINNYNVTVNIADYANFSDTYTSSDGEELQLNYYVLPANLEKARIQFEQVKPMLQCYEKLYGKYPFWNDGYALVETSYWGMEHQSAIAYGNNYVNNEFGFDFIIVHESGHEYWGNSISAEDHAEMWIHESFTTYTDALFAECLHDFDTSVRYLLTQKSKIANKEPVLGPKGVNYQGWNDSDMYYKGAWMLHSMRNTINNDEIWFKTLRALYQQFKYKIVTTEDIVSTMSAISGYKLKPVFAHFLNHTAVPQLEYRLKTQNKISVLEYRWNSPVKDFNMGMIFTTDKISSQIIYPKTKWQKLTLSGNPSTLAFAHDQFYFETKEVK